MTPDPIPAKETRPGRMYKTVKGQGEATYYLRSLILPAKYCADLQKKIDKYAVGIKPGERAEMALELDDHRIYMAFKRNPNQIMMRRIIGGTDQFTKQPYLSNMLTLVPVDHPFIDVGEAPPL